VIDTIRIEDLHAQVDGKPILHGVDLTLRRGEIHALMGPNGSGKSTLANVLMGHPKYQVTGGRILLDGEDIADLDGAERARRGLFLAFQYPVEIPGLSVAKFLKRALEVRAYGDGGGTPPNMGEFMRDLHGALALLELDPSFTYRNLNEGFSGGEKKRMEILQMLVLKPGFAVLDETDSGLDIDALKIVAKGVNALRGDGFGALIITHYQRILNHIRPDVVDIMYRGRIVTSGGKELVEELETHGYEWVRERWGIEEESHV